MPSATVTTKGQITIPKAVRRALRIAAGDRLDFVLEGEGRVVVSAGVTDVEDLKGILRRRGTRPVSVKQMNEAVLRQGRPR